MASFTNSCCRCGADTSDNFYAKFHLAPVCSACMRIQQQNEELAKTMENDRRARASERSYSRSYDNTPSISLPPLPPEVKNSAPFQQILWASGEKRHNMSFIEVLFRGFFETIQPVWYFIMIIGIIYYLSKLIR